MNSLSIIKHWLKEQGWKPFPFQQEAWKQYLAGKSGLLNAPTGSGKTYALWLACMAKFMEDFPKDWQEPKKARQHKLRVLWITPLRALTKDLAKAMQASCDGVGMPWRVAIRTGDTSAAERQKLKKQLPDCLLTTPETLHLLLAQKKYAHTFKHLDAVIIDEWHELLGTKRGVQVELGLSRLRALKPELRVWGISATVGNMEQAARVLAPQQPPNLIKAAQQKNIHVASLLPDQGKPFPWVGHLGFHLLPKVLPIIQESQTTLLFTNTRAQTEMWYQRLLEASPDLAGAMAMHHGSLDKEVRDWVEDALHQGILKVVVCTSSLDLGVDFRPVETVIQVGSPKGVARFLQRAGRSGHRPGALSKIFFLPTHGLELVEGAALRQATKEVLEKQDTSHIEARTPLTLAYDVLLQYLVTLAVSDGFKPEDLHKEVAATYCFRKMPEEAWNWCLDFLTTGGNSLTAYNEYHKLVVEEGIYKVTSRKIALQHRLSMGTIVSEPLVKVKFQKGSFVGTVEEYFISKLNPGDVFWFAGRNLEFVRLKEMTATVKASTKKATQTPRWLGGRLPLSSELASLIRKKLERAAEGNLKDPEMGAIGQLLTLQQEGSCIPKRNELLIEYVQTKEGYHAFFYPFQGRLVHEVMAAVIAYRISQLQPITFSLAMNDYGFELLSDVEIPLEHALSLDLFASEELDFELQQSMNQTEMAKRKFREIAQVAGLIFQGYPGKSKRRSHLHASSALLFEVFEEYEPNSLLIQQAFREVMAVQVEQPRLEEAFKAISQQRIVLKKPPKPTPFSMPILVDRLRSTLSSESIADRIAKLQAQIIAE